MGKSVRRSRQLGGDGTPNAQKLGIRGREISLTCRTPAGDSGCMSGALLLKQLQQRRQPVVATASSASSSVPALPANLNDDDFSSSRILICDGVDCAGLGSGAVLMEIEELCKEVYAVTGRRLDVGGSVCTLQCANAPVVNVHRKDEKGVSLYHHSKVDSPQRCAQVVEDASGHSDLAARPGGGPMLRRADGMRWNALRQQARLLRQSPRCTSLPQDPLPSRQLALALQAEANAVHADPIRRARAERRALRLTASAPLGPR